MKTLHKILWTVLVIMVTLTVSSCKKSNNGDDNDPKGFDINKLEDYCLYLKMEEETGSVGNRFDFIDVELFNFKPGKKFEYNGITEKSYTYTIIDNKTIQVYPDVYDGPIQIVIENAMVTSAPPYYTVKRLIKKPETNPVAGKKFTGSYIGTNGEESVDFSFEFHSNGAVTVKEGSKPETTVSYTSIGNVGFKIEGGHLLVYTANRQLEGAWLFSWTSFGFGQFTTPN